MRCLRLTVGSALDLGSDPSGVLDQSNTEHNRGSENTFGEYASPDSLCLPGFSFYKGRRPRERLCPG